LGQEEESYRVAVKVRGVGAGVKVKLDGEEKGAVDFEVAGGETKKVNLSLICDLEFMEMDKMDHV